MASSSAPNEFGNPAERAPDAPPLLLSICIPAYNRAAFLGPLLDSIAAQEGDDFEVVISEDASPQREQIRAIAAVHAQRCSHPLRYTEVEHNLGYDGNVRRLVSLARGRYCFFMGNDDLLAPGALEATRRHLAQHPGLGLLLRAYSWFRGAPDNVLGTARYVTTPTLYAAGAEAVAMCFRRSGVISGYIVAREPAQAAATDRFDGSLYYQMHLTACVGAALPALAIPEVLVLCRDQIPPDFGVAPGERDRFVPGQYTPQARVHMLRGVMAILDAHTELAAAGTRDLIVRDYARHFYPFVMDQLALPWRAYLRMCREMARTPVGRYPSFYVNCIVAYVLGRQRTDACLLFLRRLLGHTPRL